MWCFSTWCGAIQEAAKPGCSTGQEEQDGHGPFGSRHKMRTYLDVAAVWESATPFRAPFGRKPVESRQGMCRVLGGISQADAGDCGVQE